MAQISTTTGTQVRAKIDSETVEQYAHDMQEGAKFPPVVVFRTGDHYVLADGFHRIMAAKQNGLLDFPADVREGTASDALRYALSANCAHGLRRSNEDKRHAVQLALGEWPNLSSAELSRICAVSDMLVKEVRDNLKNLEVEAPPAPRIGKDGKKRKMPAKKLKPTPKTAKPAASAPRTAQAEPEHIDHAPTPPATPVTKTVHVSQNSGENEWYTPPEFIAAARAFMGTIDVDPASCEAANQTVKADTFYSADQDGLKQKWSGNVWLNPPYSQPLVAQFAKALCAKYKSGEVTQACVLVNNATETAWFQTLAGFASAICFPSGRTKFIHRDGQTVSAPLQGQAVLYLGVNKGQFDISFSKFGTVLFSRDP